MKGYDAIVVGGGAIGTSTIFHLAKRGVKRALLLEKFGAYGRGATGIWGSLVRMFFANAQVTELAVKSVPFYNEFQERVGELFPWTKTGSLYFIPRDRLQEYEPQLTAMRQGQLPFSILDAVEGRALFPDFSWYETDVAIYESQAGVACPTGSTAALAQAAQRLGAETELAAEVVEILKEGDRATGVRLANGAVYEGDQIIVCSGIWTNALLAPLPAETRAFPRSLQLSRFCRHHGELNHPFFVDISAMTFGHPTQNGSFIGGYLGGQLDGYGRSVDHLSVELANEAKHKIAQRIPWVKTATLEGGIKALENYTQERMGFVERLPNFRNVIVSTGWSCTGFTLAPAIGAQIAEMVTGSEVVPRADLKGLEGLLNGVDGDRAGALTVELSS
ncbi:MAG: FAD-binding oxidoreductase [Deltaproteobacteria bacterium]|nr:FAD-binding oxidoreductase [Deltaproteobacteria bacterium]MBI3295576.1 FAD-binding oxidoreductase [Deltaproteobacteria bacterium]